MKRLVVVAAALALAACNPAEPERRSDSLPPSYGSPSPTAPSDSAPVPSASPAAPSAPDPISDTPVRRLASTAGDSEIASAPPSFVPQAAASSVALSPIHQRTAGNATIRFWVVRVERTGRDRFEYHFHASVQNGGGSLLRGALMVASNAAATRVVDSCATFGTTPPGTTRDVDSPFVVAQDRNVAFDPAALSFSIAATPDLALCRDPGRVTLRRLNRTEYDNTVRDLLGTSQTPAGDFPADDFGYGFDTIGDVLALSPLLLEKAESAASRLVEEALRIYPPAAATRVQAETGSAECGAVSGNAWLLWSSCRLTLEIPTSVPATFQIRVRAWGTQAGPDPARMQILVNGAAVSGAIDVPVTSANPATYTVTASLPQGLHAVQVDFLNDYYDPPHDRNLYVDWIELHGPLDAPPPAAQITALRALCDFAVHGRVPCTRERLAAFARKAWRRPLATAELDALVALADDAFADGAATEDALGVAMRAVLTSPHFLFRVERDPHPRSAEAHPLSDHELATRLSYFLWASMPDATLDQLADAGQLVPALPAQVARMVQDPKARGFVDAYAGQWLGTRALDDVNPDYAYFPSWDQALLEAMRDETHLVLLEFLQSDVPMLNVFDAPFTYANDRLAQHYGLTLPGSTTPVRVALPPGGQRGGLFTHGSILTTNSQPRRTSVVKRGKWALDQILCIEIDPPPAGVEGMLDDPGATGTLRERLEAHRSNPECGACHAYLDPIGLGLENFDAIGAWRTIDEGQPIDATGQFPDGRSFDGPRQMAALVKADPNTQRCLAERLLIYALGRGVGPNDDPHLDAITAAFQGNGGSFADLVVAIVQSQPFRSRRGEPSEVTP